MLLVALLAASADTGGWQYTRWGMTEAEVKAAAPNPTVPFNSRAGDRDGGFARLVTYHQAGNITFNVAFRFSSEGRLNGVMVVPRDYAQCSTILEQLKSAYGRPEEVAAPKYQLKVRWRAPSVGSVVKFLSSETMESVGRLNKPPYCEIDYTPAATPETIGF